MIKLNRAEVSNLIRICAQTEAGERQVVMIGSVEYSFNPAKIVQQKATIRELFQQLSITQGAQSVEAICINSQNETWGDIIPDGYRLLALGVAAGFINVYSGSRGLQFGMK